ncbi:glycoside hydrolase family 2 TIM barrel-domain containing protein [Rathayibacter sp. VKM Ac-2927]|uniref:glycoside hydrolase family 2 TIM barrel-domain containing protein n=1 Tax=Rathayibacter sp. VKM Ac-2927 TaxID=2929478 RepID=UPI001FB3F8B8|nr:glycoside hydrolase family 2 TIM barrel-domain containing protein [Rathayibacter sp. VKM Ac-2927]MCJ1687017.1 DUF4981 domain-containing protein [Rathayibacter sp. VKM Ac-2927]
MPHLGTTAPGSSSRLAPRSWLHSDAPALSLDGDWAFRLLPGDPGDGVWAPPPFADPSTSTDGWRSLRVPSHWALEGHGRPVYTNIRYPFPVDPPHVPDENPTGDHRRSFELPAAFDGAAQVLLRFDGVESLATVWLNGVEIGWFTGSRLATEFDVTEHLVPGENVLAVRVHQFSAASYLEDQDQWWLAGIFRSVTLLARPALALDDVDVTASYDEIGGSGELTVVPTGAFPITIRVPELGIHEVWDGPDEVAPLAVPSVEAWSAESPRLYDATVASPEETVTLRLGFRSVRIEGDRLLANGRPLVFRGVNRHESHPDRGRVHDAAATRADLELMKRHGITAIRTAHQPPHPSFLDLADELGFWVVLECDLETHGFWEVSWAGNPSDDPAWRDAFLDRVQRTVERDKNHPSVVVWSLGNEAGTGRNLAAMAAWVHERDLTRPVHYEGDYEGAYTDLYSRMYPTLEEIHSVCGEQTMPVHEIGPAAGARQRSKPFLLCEYGHAMGNGPGALADYEALVDRYPRHHGGFIWEWRDHGLRTRTADGTEFFGYGGDFGEALHDGIFIMDGLVLSDGTPTPALAEFAAVAAEVALAIDPGLRTLEIRNRRHTLDTADLEFEWTLEDDGRPVTHGAVEVSPVAAGGVAHVPLLLPTPPLTGAERWLTVRTTRRAATAWSAAGHVVATAQASLGRPSTRPRPTTDRLRRTAEGAALGGARFAADGTLIALAALPMAGPRLELWRAPTENDRLDGQGSYEVADPALTNGRGDEDVPPSADRWRERGLDRLRHRTLSVEFGEHGLVRRVRSMAAGTGIGVETRLEWTLVDTGLLLRADIEPFGVWDCTWPRVGLRFDLPGSLADGSVEWFGTGPAESYPDSRAAARVGRFSSAVDALEVAYARPQESGHRSDLRSLELGPLSVTALPDARGRRPGFQLSRHTPQQRSAAAHPHELPPSDTLHLFVDAAQHGLGSRACGPDVLPKDALWPGAHRLTLVLG